MVDQFNSRKLITEARLRELVVKFLLFFFIAACSQSNDSIKKADTSQTKAGAQHAALTIYTYSSFMSVFGPGPELAKKFEENCQCTVNFVNAGDAGLILQRMKIVKSPVDVVIGLDQFRLREALKSHSWLRVPLEKKVSGALYKEYSKSALVPFDWAPLGVIYRKKDLKGPAKLEDIVTPSFAKKMSIPDPRSSSPGLLFLIHFAHGKSKSQLLESLKVLRGSLHSVSPSWSSSYGIFKSGQAEMTYSYQTSLLYHWKEEKNKSFSFSVFADGHPIQVEFAGVPKNRCKECELAQEFVRFMVSAKAQTIIYNKNYMLPIDSSLALDHFGDKLSKLKLLKFQYDYFSPQWETYKKSLLKAWQASSVAI